MRREFPVTKERLLQAVPIILLVAAGVFGHQAWSGPGNDVLIVGFVLFGIVNVLLSATGTRKVRTITIGVVFLGVVSSPGVLEFLVAATWLLWPPVFMLAWTHERRTTSSVGAGELRDRPAATRSRIALAVLIGAVAAAAIAYRLLVLHNLQQTAALFVGIPALLAIVTIFAVAPRSATGVACKAVTVGLLVSLIFLNEGILCVAMSAPLFYAVAILLARTVRPDPRACANRTTTMESPFIVLAVTIMSLEGVTGFTTFSRNESVTESRVVAASLQAVETSIFQPPRFERLRPLYLRAGFPSPVAARIERAGSATRWIIEFRGGEMRLNGLEPSPGDLVLEMEEARPGLVRWRAVSDTSHMTHFLTWTEATVQWTQVDANTTRVTWTLRYDRGLDPAWYFGPMERYAVGLVAGYLIDAVAIP